MWSGRNVCAGIQHICVLRQTEFKSHVSYKVAQLVCISSSNDITSHCFVFHSLGGAAKTSTSCLHTEQVEEHRSISEQWFYPQWFCLNPLHVTWRLVFSSPFTQTRLWFYHETMHRMNPPKHKWLENYFLQAARKLHLSLILSKYYYTWKKWLNYRQSE